MLAKISHRKHYDAGQVILTDDETPDYFANVLSGVVKLTKMLPDGREQIVGLQFGSDFLGRPLRSRVPYFAEAATPVELCCFSTSEFEKLLKITPSIERRLFENALSELDAAREWILILGQKTAQEKVASFIHLLARRAAQSGCGHSPQFGPREVRFALPLTRAEIGDFLGLTIETVSRQMTRLKSQGYIKLDGLRIIDVPDMDRLEQLAEG
jgi:CRP/FNR family transcriptional regulator, anaerobic regulatory protein